MIRVLEGFKSSLTPREQKGLNFERLVYKKVKDFTPVYHPQSKGVDFLFHFGSQSIELEAKFSHARIYPSWTMRDWVSRFQLKDSIKIVVTNRGIKLGESSLYLLRAYKIYLVYYDKLRGVLEWIRFLFSGERRKGREEGSKGNKLFEARRYNIEYYNNNIEYSYLASNTLHEYTKHEYTLHNRGWRRGVYHPFLKKPRAISKHHLRFCNFISIHLLTLKGHLQIINSRIHPFTTSVFPISLLFENEPFLSPSSSANYLTLALQTFQCINRPDTSLLTLRGRISSLFTMAINHGHLPCPRHSKDTYLTLSMIPSVKKMDTFDTTSTSRSFLIKEGNSQGNLITVSSRFL